MLGTSEVGFGWVEVVENPDEWMDINRPGASLAQPMEPNASKKQLAQKPHRHTLRRKDIPDRCNESVWA